MFKKSLLIIGLTASLHIQTYPFTCKNTIRGLAATTSIYCTMALLLNTYMTRHFGFRNLGLSAKQRIFGSLSIICANACLFKIS